MSRPAAAPRRATARRDLAALTPALMSSRRAWTSVSRGFIGSPRATTGRSIGWARRIVAFISLLFHIHLTFDDSRWGSAGWKWDGGSGGNEPSQVGSNGVEPLATKAVVRQRTLFGEDDQARRAQLGHVVLDRGLRQLQRLGDLGQVAVAVREQPEDSQAGRVAEGAMKTNDGRGWFQGIVDVQRRVGDRVAIQPPAVPAEQEVVRAREIARRQDHPVDAGLRHVPDAAGDPLDEVAGSQASHVG